MDCMRELLSDCCCHSVFVCTFVSYWFSNVGDGSCICFSVSVEWIPHFKSERPGSEDFSLPDIDSNPLGGNTDVASSTETENDVGTSFRTSKFENSWHAKS